MILLNPNGGCEGCGPTIRRDPVTGTEAEDPTQREHYTRSLIH